MEVRVDLKGMAETIRSFEKMGKSIDAKFLKGRQAYYLKPMVQDMRNGTKSTRLDDPKIIGVTTAKNRTPKYGVKVGVIRNDVNKFPKFSSFALASVIEYGTGERIRRMRKMGFTLGTKSTGSMPSTPFLRPAFDNNRDSFMDNVEQAVIRKVQRSG